jgi:hypothetical protein
MPTGSRPKCVAVVLIEPAVPVEIPLSALNVVRRASYRRVVTHPVPPNAAARAGDATSSARRRGWQRIGVGILAVQAARFCSALTATFAAVLWAALVVFAVWMLVSAWRLFSEARSPRLPVKGEPWPPRRRREWRP